METASHKLLEAAVYRTLHAHNFSRSSSQATFSLTDLFSRYLTLLSTTCAKYANHSGRTSMSVRDAIGALDELGVSMDELSAYCSSEGRELGRYAIHSARRVEDLNEFRAQLVDGRRQDRDDAIPLRYAPYDHLSEEDEEEGDKDDDMDVDSTPPVIQKRTTDMRPPFSMPPPGQQLEPRRIPTPPLPLSPLSTLSSMLRKRPRKANWQPPDHVPDFLPPFPTADPTPPPSAHPSPVPTQIQPPLPLPLPVDNQKVEKTQLNMSQPVTSAAASDYLLQVPYSQSSLSGVAEWHLPTVQHLSGQTANIRNPHLPTPQMEHSLVAAYHHILTHPPSANGTAPSPARHKVAMALLTQIQNSPRWEEPDTLYSSVTPCSPRVAVIGPTFPIAIEPAADGQAKVDGKDKEFKFPPTPARPVISTERLSPLVSQQSSRIPDLARVVLPQNIYLRTSRLTHPPPLQRGSKFLTYGSGVPAPWNASTAPLMDAPPVKEKEKEKESETVKKPVLPDARLFATWDYESKDYRVPLAPTMRTRGRVGTQSSVLSLSRPKLNHV